MTITQETANLMMDSMAFVLCRVMWEEHIMLDPEVFRQRLEERTRNLFVAFCDGEGITEIECE